MTTFKKELEELYLEMYPFYLKSFTFKTGTVWDAEDVIQEAFVRALKYLKTYDGSGMKNWFSKILLNAFYQHLNDARGHPISLDETLENELDPVRCSMLADEIMSEVKKDILKEPEPAREILHHHFHNEMTPNEIAEYTGLGIWAIYKTIQRFREKIKMRYGNEIY